MSDSRVVQIEPVGPAEADRDLSVRTGTDRSVGYLDYNLYCRLVDQLPEMTELRLQGRCEPLLHLHLFDMVRYAVERGLLVSMTSGLSVLSEARAEECVNSGLYRIRMLIDAARSRLSTAGPLEARFLRVLRNLRRLMRARVRLQSLQPEVVLTGIIDRRDLLRLPHLVRFAGEEGVQELSIELADRMEDDGERHAACSPAFVRAVFDDAQTLARSFGIVLHPLRFARDGQAKTQAGTCIGYRGEALSCGAGMSDPHHPYGLHPQHSTARAPHYHPGWRVAGR